MPLLCLRASVAIADERRRGMLAPLFLAGIGPAGLVWSKLKGALRPAVPLTAMAVIFWLAFVGRLIGGFTDPRLWLASLAVLAAVGAGYFLAVSLGLLASAYAPSPRVALLAALGLLFAWNALPQVVPHVVQWAWPGISIGKHPPPTRPSDRRRARWSYQHPHGPRDASLTRLPGELGRLLDPGHDARRPRRVDRRRLPGVARARSAGRQTRPDSPRTGLTSNIPGRRTGKPESGCVRMAPGGMKERIPPGATRLSVKEPCGEALGLKEETWPDRSTLTPAMREVFFH